MDYNAYPNLAGTSREEEVVGLQEHATMQFMFPTFHSPATLMSFTRCWRLASSITKRNWNAPGTRIQVFQQDMSLTTTSTHPVQILMLSIWHVDNEHRCAVKAHYSPV